MRIGLYNILSMAVVIALFGSCRMDHLHYETSQTVQVRIDVDWTVSGVSPNGISTYVYDSNGDLYTSQLSSNPDVVYLNLPVGNYTAVMHNNSISEIGGVELRNMSTLEGASIYATERSDEPSFDVVGDEMLFVNEPDDVLSYTLRNINVTASDAEYHYYQPDLESYEQDTTLIYQATPEHIVHLSRVVAHISGLEYSTGTPAAILRGMSGGYDFDAETTSDGDVMEEFKVNTKVTKTDSDDSGEDDTIYVDYNTFGMHETDPEDQLYYLDIRFTLIDGSYQDYHIDITDDIRTETTDIQNIHIVEVELESLPEVEGSDDSSGEDGSFEPSVDEWVSVVVPLPM